MKTKTFFYLTLPEMYLLKMFDLTQEELQTNKQKVLEEFGLDFEFEFTPSRKGYEYLKNIEYFFDVCESEKYKVGIVFYEDLDEDKYFNLLLKFSEREPSYKFTISKCKYEYNEDDDVEVEDIKTVIFKVKVKNGLIIKKIK